ncbi:Uncharacterised protein [Mycobacteroides abscessus subsp. abscessus]|nr:Uncharacterised protein [Mycobacteroides abscessus subsp. abscessus]
MPRGRIAPSAAARAMASSRAGYSAGLTPLRLRPVSTLTVRVAGAPLRRTASSTSSNWRTEATATCTSAANAGAKSVPGRFSHDNTGAVMPACRNASASPMLVTPSSAAPAARAARATCGAPCP